MPPILSITGSDNSGWSGLQLDLKIITEMGAHALTAATCIVMPNVTTADFPAPLVRQQVEHIVTSFHPRAVKIGLIRTPEAVAAVAEELAGCSNIVVAPGFLSSSGSQLIDDVTIAAIAHYLVPKCDLLVLRQVEAEKMLGIKITSDEEMRQAAHTFIRNGAKHVMLRGGQILEGRVTALLASADSQQFFSSYNIEGWKQHGVGGALSTAIATRMGMGDDVPAAVRRAHEYVHSRIVYAVNETSRRLRPADIYNAFMHLLPNHYRVAHDVTFYADRLHISTRYLSQITHAAVEKSPKQIIAGYLLLEARQLLENSRLSVKEISDTLGFSSSALFCKFFKQWQGVTPNEYRLSVSR